MLKRQEFHGLPSDELQQEQTWLQDALTTFFLGRNIVSKENRKKKKKMSALLFSWDLSRQKQKPTPRFLHEARCSVLILYIQYLLTFSVQLIFLLNTSTLEKATFMLSKILHFPCTKVLLYFLVLGEFYLRLYICTKTQLFHFFSPLFFFFT